MLEGKIAGRRYPGRKVTYMFGRHKRVNGSKLLKEAAKDREAFRKQTAKLKFKYSMGQ